jgi:hypothetical protein
MPLAEGEQPNRSRQKGSWPIRLDPRLEPCQPTTPQHGHAGGVNIAGDPRFAKPGIASILRGVIEERLMAVKRSDSSLKWNMAMETTSESVRPVEARLEIMGHRRLSARGL